MVRFKKYFKIIRVHLRQLQALVTAHGPEAAPLPVAVPPQFPAETAARYQALLAHRPARLETMIAELEALETSRAQVRGARGAGLRDLPVRVLSQGVAQAVPAIPDEVNRAYEAAWQAMQAEMAAESSRGERVVAGQSGHMIHHDQPELVVQAIEQVVRGGYVRAT